VEQIARDPRADFLAVYNRSVNRREGAVAMLKWLENETDFFTAPASSKHHLAQPGGLVTHSLNVWRRLREITVRDLTGRYAPGVCHISEAEEETVAILGLLHDVCKAGVYHQETKRRKNQETGKWEDYLGYTFRDPFPLGHGEKSLFLITRHMALTEEEALAIRWHMGAYDDAVKGGSRSMTEAMNLTPWVWRLQEADMCAAWIDERSAAE
jgi:hypothetical protein